MKSAAYTANYLSSGAIEALQDNIRIEQTLRNVTIVSPDGFAIPE
jgi:hypothetical protein